MSLVPNAFHTRDTTDVQDLPAGSDNLALQHATRGPDLLAPPAEVRRHQLSVTVRSFLWCIPTLVVVFFVRCLCLAPLDIVMALCGIIAVVALFVIVKGFTFEEPTLQAYFALAAVGWVVAITIVQHSGFNTLDALFYILPGALLFTVIGCYMIAAQVTHVMLCTQRFSAATRERYRHRFAGIMTFESYLSNNLASGFHDRIIATFGALVFGGLSIALVAYGGLPVLWLGATTFGFYLAALAVQAALEFNGEQFLKCFGAGVRGLVAFLNYNTHESRSPGVVQFPNQFLRHYPSRWLLLLVPLVLLATAVVCATFPPIQLREGILTAFSGITALGWMLAGVSLVLTVTVPFAMFVLIFCYLCGPVLSEFEDAPTETAADETTFHDLVNTIQTSHDPVEARSRYLGQSVYGDNPILLDQEIKEKHGVIRGGSGTGKSAAIERLMIQEIMFNSWGRIADPRDPSREPRADRTSILYLDMKGEPRTFHTLREECERRGMEFKFVTVRPDNHSFLFNPLSEPQFRNLPVNHKTEQLLTTIGGNYGRRYGASFFTSINQIVLMNYVYEYFPHMETFADIANLLKDKSAYDRIGELDDWRTARHLQALVQQLGNVHQLNLRQSECEDMPQVWDRRIRMRDLFCGQPKFFYFYLPAMEVPTTGPMIGKLALFMALLTAMNREPGDTNKLMIVADEFQQLVDGSLRTLLEQARSMGVHFLLAHQHTSQLREGDALDLGPVIDSCTKYQIEFEFSDADSMARLERLGPIGVIAKPSWKQTLSTTRNPWADGTLALENAATDSNGNPLVSVGVEYVPLLDRNRLLYFSAHPRVGLVRFTQKSNYTQHTFHVPFMFDFHTSKAEADRLAACPWPTNYEGTFPIDPKFDRTRKEDAS